MINAGRKIVKEDDENRLFFQMLFVENGADSIWRDTFIVRDIIISPGRGTPKFSFDLTQTRDARLINRHSKSKKIGSSLLFFFIIFLVMNFFFEQQQ